MTEFIEREPRNHPSIEAFRNKESLIIHSDSYSLAFRYDKPFIELRDAKDEVWAVLPQFSSLDTTAAKDETLGVGRPTAKKQKDSYTITIPAESTAWTKKTQVWKCSPDTIEMFHEVEGDGEISRYDILGGSLLDKKGGYYPAGKQFDKIFTPEATSLEAPHRSSEESASINVTGTSRPGNYDWFATPAPWCFGANKSESNLWLMMGIAAPIEEQHFHSLNYQPYEGSFSLALEYDGRVPTSGSYRTPSLVMHFDSQIYAGLAGHRQQLERRGLTPRAGSDRPDWWKNSMYCGWGSQVEEARARSTTPQQFATQQFYDDELDHLEQNGVWPSTITIDDKWQQDYATNFVDKKKWPSLENWTERQHNLGRKVLFWVKAWDAEGADPGWCIQRPDGQPVTVDPTNPEWRDMTFETMRRLLTSSGYNGDGLKIDFTADTPIGRSLRSHRPVTGSALLHKYLKIVYAAAKDAKRDALVVTHTPNAQFADVTDMYRLNDVNTGHEVVEQLWRRYLIGKAALPHTLTDPDNWPMPSRSDWRSYLTVQRRMRDAIPVTYFSRTVAGQPLTRLDYERLHEMGFKRPPRSKR